MSWLSELLMELDREWAREEVEEIIEALQRDCHHYGPVECKFNGGRQSLFCALCSFHICDRSEGQLVLPARIIIEQKDE